MVFSYYISSSSNGWFCLYLNEVSILYKDSIQNDEFNICSNMFQILNWYLFIFCKKTCYRIIIIFLYYCNIKVMRVNVMRDKGL